MYLYRCRVYAVHLITTSKTISSHQRVTLSMTYKRLQTVGKSMNSVSRKMYLTGQPLAKSSFKINPRRKTFARIWPAKCLRIVTRLLIRMTITKPVLSMYAHAGKTTCQSVFARLCLRMLKNALAKELLSTGEKKSELVVSIPNLSPHVLYIPWNHCWCVFNLGVQCNVGQRFEACGSSCQHSCSDISNQVMCQNSCTEGCYCPPGYTLDENEVCIPISECPCLYDGEKHAVGYVNMRNKTGSVQAWYV